MIELQRKTTAACCLLAGLVLTACVERTNRLSPEASVAILRADRDADGSITVEEWTELSEREFAALDIDQDGEFGADDAPAAVFVQDDNGDGVLDRNESPTLVRFADSDGDGTVTVDELDNVYARTVAFDANADGRVDREEYIAARAERFDQFDLNNDGVIGPEEFRLVIFRF